MLSFILSWIKRNTDFTILSLFIVGIIIFALELGGWRQPLIVDRTFHLYSSQMIAKGAVPYVDYFNVHPPLGVMLIALPMYIFPGLQFGVGPSIVHSGITLLWSIAGVIALYYIAKRITGTRLGGLLSISFWIFLTPLFIRYFSVGENRLLVVSSILMAMALLQRSKWYWAGFSLAIGFMTYYPTALAGLAVILVVLGQNYWKDRFRAAAIFSAGFFTVTGLVALWLLYKGALLACIDVTMRWPFEIGFGNPNVERTFVESIVKRYQGLLKVFLMSYSFWGINMLWIPIGGCLGLIFFVIKNIKRNDVTVADFFLSEKIAPPFVATIVFFLYVLVERGPLDAIMLECFLTIWISLFILEMLSLLRGYSFIGYCASFLILYGCMFLFGYKIFDSMSTLFERGATPNWRIKVKNYDGSVHLQTEAGEKLFESYPEDKNILVLGDLWLLNVTNRDNQSHFYHTGRKMRLAAELAGYATPENNVWNQLATLDSDLIFIANYRKGAKYQNLTEKYADEDYACVGEASNVFIIMPKDDIEALPALLSMQQVFSSPQSIDHSGDIEILEIEDLGRIQNLQINEIAPGALLLGYQIDEISSGSITLFWWNWLDRDRQKIDIHLEIKRENETVFEKVVNEERFPKYSVFKQIIELPDEMKLKRENQVIISHKENQIDYFPCKSDFTTGPITIPLVGK